MNWKKGGDSVHSENLYWIWLSDRLGVASKYLTPLIERFESPFEIYSLTEDELIMSGCVPKDIASRLSNKNLGKAYNIMDSCTVGNIGILSYADKFYPASLRSIKDPPAVLYYKGSLIDFNEKLCIAVVGTRTMSEYGKRTAYKMGYELASAGAVVVSGMALGVDSVAACGAITAGGKTIAVLGCGVDIVYPREHAKLKKIIENNGVVISEFAPGTSPMGSNFPIRNRIISGIAQGTLVIEADARSGALITARSALVQGREVFAVPGNIDESNSSGTNAMIKGGATTVLSADDILINYELTYGRFLNYAGLAYSKQTYEYSEGAIERMGISSRRYNNAHKENTSGELKTTGLKIRNKPVADEKKSEAPSTKTKDGSGADPKAASKKAPPHKKDNSEELLAQMDEKTRRIFEEIPIDRAATIEMLCNLGFTAGDVLMATTALEMNGLINILPGGLYVRV